MTKTYDGEVEVQVDRVTDNIVTVRIPRTVYADLTSDDAQRRGEAQSVLLGLSDEAFAAGKAETGTAYTVVTGPGDDGEIFTM